MIIWLNSVVALKPIVLIPPSYGSNLYASFNETDMPWYCPKSMENELLWIDPLFFIPHRTKCFHRMMTVHYDKEKDDVANYPNVSIYTKDFGGDETTRYVAKLKALKVSVGESITRIIDYFLKKNYTIKKDLFTAPYDWRIAPFGIDDFWKNLTELIERAYEENNQQKITIFAYSYGGYNALIFLTEKISEEWKQKYIDRLVLLAPSLGGTMINYVHFWKKRSPLLPLIYTKEIEGMLESWPIAHMHFMNTVIFGNETLVRSPEDIEYTAEDLIRITKEHGKISDDLMPLFDKAMKYVKSAPKEPKVPTTIIYNSGIQTLVKANYEDGWNSEPKHIMGEGDGTIPAQVPKWVCNNWPVENNPVHCFDISRSHKSFDHQGIAKKISVLDLIYNLSISNDWIVQKNRKFVKLPLYTENGTILQEAKEFVI